ncbi:hypothetical protein DHEL01_v205980 [Diaporthe helianthi]|uniref:Apple domain-containing protein n=1 Tax=Diaporthe helianthi TaxID=158607 RepID=A0A2P5HZF0_DIAHE|nr:hypothetical protein DHEL01_v205980 [Diaporthe helianthi]
MYLAMDRDHRHQSASPTISPYSDAPEVVRQDDDPGLQVVPDTGQTPEVKGSDSTPIYVDGPHYVHASSLESDSKTIYGERQRDRICGLTPRRFWVLAIATTLIIGGAIGGGVAGALLRNHASSSSSSSSSSPIATAATGTSESPTTSAPPDRAATTAPTATESIQSTKTAIYGPSGTVLYRDCPANANAVYTSDAMDSLLWRKYCDNTTFVSAKPGQRWVNTFTNDLDSCIDMCAESNVNRESEIAAGNEDLCNAVCWRNGFENDDYPGQCFGFTTANATTTEGGFQFKDDWRCDSAGVISENYVPGKG